MNASSEQSDLLSERVRTRRIELGLSYNDLALRLKNRGVKLSRQAISLWERGKKQCRFSDDEIDLIADALGWTAEELCADL